MPSAPGEIHVLYFAWLRERVGLSEERVAPPATVGTIATLMAWLAARDDRHAAAFAQPALIRCALNQEFSSPDHPIKGGDEVAFFPPVTGG